MKLLSCVALLEPRPKSDLPRGSVGTIVEDLPDAHYLVEFADNRGQTYAMEAFSERQLLELHHEKTVSAG